MNRRAGGAAHGSEEGQPGKCGSFVKQLLVRKIAETEILPTHGLFLAAVPIEDVSKQPSGLLLGGALAGLKGNAFGKARGEGGNLLLPFAQRRADRSVAGGGPRNLRASCYGL